MNENEQIDYVELQKQLVSKLNESNDNKYDTSGIYGIFLDFVEGDSLDQHRKLLYIGKSKNMANRTIQHYIHVNYPYCNDSRGHKYEIIRLLKKCGYTIVFDVIKYCDVSLLDEAEGEYIRKYLPPLNYQIPKISGGYTINKQAQTITVKEILENEK